jgi:hypothetical protein
MSERDWTTRTPEPGAAIEIDGLTIRCEPPAGATLVSGDLEAAIAALTPGAPMLGLLARRPTGPHALRIGRDRALLCTAEPLGIEGWHGRYAASSADDLFLSFTVTGPRMPDIRSSCLSVQDASPSAATRVFGHTALVTGLADGIAIHVERPDAAAVWARLEMLSRSM